MEQDYLIAGLRVRMDSFGRTVTQAEPYLTQFGGEPDIVITSLAEEFHAKHPHLSLEDSEYLCTGGSFYRQLLPFNGMMIHASAVVKDGYAYLFTAPCGTGKSTHTSMWFKAFGDSVIMLNDDKPAIRKIDDRWYAYGTPWSGKTAQNTNIRVPLGGICILTRGGTNEIEPFTGVKAAFALMEQTARPATTDGRGLLMELLNDLLEAVPVWKLRCTPTEDAALVSHKAMSEEAKNRFE